MVWLDLHTEVFLGLFPVANPSTFLISLFLVAMQTASAVFTGKLNTFCRQAMTSDLLPSALSFQVSVALEHRKGSPSRGQGLYCPKLGTCVFLLRSLPPRMSTEFYSLLMGVFCSFTREGKTVK